MRLGSQRKAPEIDVTVYLETIFAILYVSPLPMTPINYQLNVLIPVLAVLFQK